MGRVQHANLDLSSRPAGVTLRGAQVVYLFPNDSAAKAGLAVGDVIRAVNGACCDATTAAAMLECAASTGVCRIEYVQAAATRKSSTFQSRFLVVACVMSISAVPFALMAGSQQPQATSQEMSLLASGCTSDKVEPDMCMPWLRAGYCDAKAVTVRSQLLQEVRAHCPRTCGHCPGKEGNRAAVASFEARCRRDNATAAVPAYRLSYHFERLLRIFPQYEPKALSRDPWLVHLTNVVSADEAAALLAACTSFRSDGLRAAHSRTSEQCRCDEPQCYTQEAVHRVERRLSELVDMPLGHAEDLNLIRYEAGQRYREHHDQFTGAWAPHGPRVFTILLYLSTPEGGGETVFPRLGEGSRSPGAHRPPGAGLRVQPRLGDAIIFPSVLDAKPMELDDRTRHESLPVTGGVKYAANLCVCATFSTFSTAATRGIPCSVKRHQPFAACSLTCA